MTQEVRNGTCFSIFHPSEPLKPFVRYYWVLKCNDCEATHTFPTGCPQLIFHRGSRFHIPETGAEQARFTISGEVNFPATIQSAGEVETIVAVFHPHAPGSMLQIPVASFFNQEIDGFSLGDKNLNAMAHAVLNSDDTEEAICLIERELISRALSSGGYDFRRIGASLKRLFSTRRLSVEDMAQTACLSRKQFERVFFKAVGMRPKEYSEVARFQKSLWMMQRGCRNFAAIAWESGYADQSHFIREFRRLSAFTPMGLVKKQTVYSDLFYTPA